MYSKTCCVRWWYCENMACEYVMSNCRCWTQADTDRIPAKTGSVVPSYSGPPSRHPSIPCAALQHVSNFTNAADAVLRLWHAIAMVSNGHAVSECIQRFGTMSSKQMCN